MKPKWQAVMSLELETLDQLLGGPMPLAVIRSIFPSDERFQQALLGLLASGEIELVAGDRMIPQWNWRSSLASPEGPSLNLRLTERGAQRIA